MDDVKSPKIRVLAKLGRRDKQGCMMQRHIRARTLRNDRFEDRGAKLAHRLVYWIKGTSGVGIIGLIRLGNGRVGRHNHRRETGRSRLSGCGAQPGARSISVFHG